MEKLYNTGDFKLVLQTKAEELFKLRRKCKDPYEQYNLDSQKKLVDELLNTYNEQVKKHMSRE